jgi:hypothetical protein
MNSPEETVKEPPAFFWLGLVRFVVHVTVCISMSCPYSTGVRLCFAICDQGMNVLNRQPWIGLVEPNGSTVRRSSEINELLKVLSAG